MSVSFEQEAAQQELSKQKQKYEEKVTNLHEAMVSADWLFVCHVSKFTVHIGCCSATSTSRNKRKELAFLLGKALADICYVYNEHRISEVE